MSFEESAQALAESILKLFNPQKRPTTDCSDVKVIAHRGHIEGHKENSFAGFKSCIEAGVWGIEFDIRWTANNIPVVVHDPDLKRTHNVQKYVNKISDLELKKIAPDVLTLKELLTLTNKQVHLMIELKESLTPEQNAILKELLKDLEPTVDFHLMSLNMAALKSITAFPKKSLISISIYNGKSILKETLLNDYGGMTGSYILLTDRYKNQLASKNMLFGSGYIDSQYSLFKELNRGVKYLFTNKPKYIIKLLQDK